jgi:hypothetical protein
MSELLNSVKADLFDRRLLPLVVVVLGGLAAAIAYLVLGGGSAATNPTGAAAGRSLASAGVAISQTTPETAVAETSGGVSQQHAGHSRNPFAPIPGTKSANSSATTASTKASSSSGSSSSGKGSSSSGSTGSSGGSTPTKPTPEPAKPSKPAKPATIYHVSVLFGLLPPAGSTAPTSLTPYENVKLLSPLPSATQPLIVFRGATAGGKSATFTLVSEAILHGDANCLPSASQCEAIDLKPSEGEQLEYVTAAGTVETYELKVVSIVASKGSSSTVTGILRNESKAGRELLRHAGLSELPDLRYSAESGVLVFAPHHKR